jgi:chondroitin AC lyase
MSILSLLCLSLSLQGFAADQKSEIALSKIHTAISADLLESFKPDVAANSEKVSSWIADNVLNAGAFSDLDYDTQSGVSWGPTLHLGRIRLLSVFYQTPGQPHYRSPEVLETIKRGIYYFIRRDFKNLNWWFNEIGVPLNIGQTLLLMSNELTAENAEWSRYFMTRGITEKGVIDGQNLGWLAQVNLYRGLLTRDETWVNKSVRSIQILLQYQSGPRDEAEGIYPDYTFIQHLSVFYNLGYGLYFSDTVSKFIGYLEGTPYALPEVSIRLFLGFVVNGQLTLIRNGFYDPSAMGRNHVRPGSQDAALMAKICARLIWIPSHYQAILKECAIGIPLQRFSLHLNRFFWNGDYMVHHRPGFQMSVKMHSTRVLNNDFPSNGEGLRSDHLSDGANYILKSGKEYQDIFPVWDYSRVPGTTAAPRQWINAAGIVGPVYHQVFEPTYNPYGYVGGVSDSQNGFMAMELTQKDIHEKKAYFFNDQGMIVLGTELFCAMGCAKVRSTLNQEWLQGSVTVKPKGRPPYLLDPETQQSSPHAEWVHHGQTLYLFPKPTPMAVSNETRSGDIQNISAQLPSKISKGRVFLLEVPREDPRTEREYAYAVQPDVSLSDAKLRSKEPGFKIVSNTGVVQAVQSGENLFQAAFYKPTYFSFSHSWIKAIQVKDPVLLQITGKNFEEVTLIASDPTQKLYTTTVTLMTRDGRRLEATFEFSPEDSYAGRPVAFRR